MYRFEKTGLRGFWPGPTQTRLYNSRRWLEALNFGFRKYRNCTSYVAKTKALISFTVTAKLICVFLFAYAKSRFSRDEAQLLAILYEKYDNERYSFTLARLKSAMQRYSKWEPPFRLTEWFTKTFCYLKCYMHLLYIRLINVRIWWNL